MCNNKLINGLSNGNGCAMGDQCCKYKANGVTANGGCTENEEVLYSKMEYTPYDPTQEPIFPPELRVGTSSLFVLVLRSN
jgi:xanthine dehydrogenase/oxidase